MKNFEKGYPVVTVSRFRRSRKRARKPRLLGLSRLTHQMANQLTVLHLTCFRLRALVDAGQCASETELARLECAIDEMQQLVELLNSIEEPGRELPSPANQPDLPRNNVYRLSEARQNDR